jgi:hypothetical protein
VVYDHFATMIGERPPSVNVNNDGRIGWQSNARVVDGVGKKPQSTVLFATAGSSRTGVNLSGDYDMKFLAVALMLAGSALANSAVLAQKMDADDLKCVNQCITDNKGGASDAIIRAYCICMNEKMDSNETRSITQWEKTHKPEMAACDKVSGWTR